MKVTLVGRRSPEDWYTIERADHENRYWTERVGDDASTLRYSGRISDACVEGPAGEMRGIAKAIEDRGYVAFKRCAVWVKGDLVYLWSPRNSQYAGVLTLEQADDLVVQVRERLGELPDWDYSKQPEYDPFEGFG